MASPPGPPNRLGIVESTTSWMLKVKERNFYIKWLLIDSPVCNISNHSCVLPVPGDPHISVIFPTGTPPSSISSMCLENVNNGLGSFFFFEEIKC